MPVRYAVITEGITDTILLPSLLREATDKDFLGFQFVSGLSETSKGNFAILENGAPSTAYLLDADKGGRELENQLRSAGIASNRIFYLPDKSGLGLVLEDFVNKEVYLKAVNEELSLRNENYKPIALSDLPEFNRPSKVKKWCKTQGIELPSKRSVAYRILDQQSYRKIVDSKRKRDLFNLYNKINTALNLPKL
jgi:predicted ATP-dependent endonuclease of OLD family